MKGIRRIAFTMVAVLLMAWSVTASAQQVGKGPVGIGPLLIAQIVLDLSDGQIAAVQEIFISSHQAREDILEDSNLTPGDMRLLCGVTGKFRKLLLKRFAAVLDQDQLLTVSEELFNDTPLEFIVLSEAEKVRRVHDALQLGEEQVGQVAVILAEESSKHEIVLENLGFTLQQVGVLQGRIITQHNEITERLSVVLTEQQLQQFEKLRSRMVQRKQGHALPPMDKGTWL